MSCFPPSYYPSSLKIPGQKNSHHHTKMAANNSYIISEIGQTKRSPQGKINTGENLRIIQPSQAFPPLLASSTIDKVGHLLVLVLVLVLLEIDVPMTTGPTPIISPTPHRPQLSSSSQGRSNSQNRRPPSGSRNQYPDNRPQPSYTDPDHCKPDLPPTPCHIIYLGQASLDQRVGTIPLPPHVTELGHLQLAGKNQTENILKDMMILPPEIKMDVHSIKIGMDKNISSSFNQPPSQHSHFSVLLPSSSLEFSTELYIF